MWDEVDVILSRKPDHKLLPFLACCIVKRQDIEIDLSRLFNQFTPDKKQDIHSRLNTFYSIEKYINSHYVLVGLLLNLPSIKPE